MINLRFLRKNKFILRSLALFMMLVFVQKAGAGLFYHNFFHSNSHSELPADKGNGYSCTCIDDFLMPFDETAEPVIAHPVSEIAIITFFFKETIHFCTPVLSSLRGPPAAILS